MFLSALRRESTSLSLFLCVLLSCTYTYTRLERDWIITTATAQHHTGVLFVSVLEESGRGVYHHSQFVKASPLLTSSNLNLPT